MAIVMVYLPWSIVFFGTLSRATPAATSGPEVMAPVVRPAWVLAALTDDYLPLGTPVLKAAVAAVFGLVALSGAFALKDRPRAALLLLCSSLGAIVLAVLLAGSLTHESKTYLIIPRTLLPASADYFVLIATALTRARTRLLSPILLVSLVLLNLYSYPNLYYRFVRAGPWREVAGYVAGNSQPGDVIVFVSGFWARPFDFYFTAHKTGLPVVRYNEPDSLSQVQAFSGQSRRIWLILKQPEAVDPRASVESYVRSTATLQTQRTFQTSIRVQLYVRR